MARQLLGLPVAEALTERLACHAGSLRARGIAPTLATVRVGERDDDLAYERAAIRRCERVGIEVRTTSLPDDCSQTELTETIGSLSADDSVHGCLLFRPLLQGLDEAVALAALAPTKDVDCATAGSLCGVFCGRSIGFAPCTAEAVMELLAYYGYRLSGARVTVVGRSLVIGRPVSMMLQAQDATVTMCHTRTRDLAEECRRADILVVAAGHAATVGADCVSPGQVVIDVGINWDDEAGRICGDVAYDEVEPLVAAITPVPRGVGSITTAVLAKHVLQAAERHLAHRG